VPETVSFYEDSKEIEKKIWDLFPAMSFLKLLNFETNLPNMEFDYSKLEKKIIFYANL